VIPLCAAQRINASKPLQEAWIPFGWYPISKYFEINTSTSDINGLLLNSIILLFFL
jgi:hypothetical protein